MGKSPGKWIKTVIFRKKSSKSSSQKTAEILAKEEFVSSKLPSFGDVARRTNGGLENVKSVDSVDGTGELEKTITGQQVEAVITVQAFIRGYLARRSFGGLKGIVKLQALVRGHLVRRQAVSTLRCTERIVRLQSWARGRRVRVSDVGSQVQKKLGPRVNLSRLSVNPRNDKQSSNALICKLLSSTPNSVAPLHFCYDPAEPNSDWQWLERWTLFKPWVPIPGTNNNQEKKELDKKAKKKTKVSNNNLQIKKSDLSRLKQVEERVSTLNNNRKLMSVSDLIHENKQTKTTSPRKSESDRRQEQPQNELERVKQNLKRISASSKVALSSSMTPQQPVVEETPKEPIIEETSTDVAVEEKKDLVETTSPENAEQVTENILKLDKEEDETIRRIDVKHEYVERVQPRSPMRPNYMSSTKSAKAKLRGFGSPRGDQDHKAENGEFLKRHSLPLYANGGSSFVSPRSDRTVAKGESKSLMASVDGNKASRPGWRR